MDIEIHWHNTGSACLVNTTLNREVFFQAGDDSSSFRSDYRDYKNTFPATHLERLWDLYQDVSQEVQP